MPRSRPAVAIGTAALLLAIAVAGCTPAAMSPLGDRLLLMAIPSTPVLIPTDDPTASVEGPVLDAGSIPMATLMAPDGRSAYAVLRSTGDPPLVSVVRIDPSTLEVVGDPLPLPAANEVGVTAAAISPDGRAAYLAFDSREDDGRPRVERISLDGAMADAGTAYMSASGTTLVGAISLASDARFAYVGESNGDAGIGRIVKVDLASGQVVASSPDSPALLSVISSALSPDGSTLYALGTFDVPPGGFPSLTLTKLSTSDLSTEASLALAEGEQGLASLHLAPDGQRAYLAVCPDECAADSHVRLIRIDTRRMQELPPIASAVTPVEGGTVGAFTIWSAITPDGEWAFVGDSLLSAAADRIPLGTPFALTTAVSGTGAGRITSDPAGIDCGTRCTAGFLDYVQVTLTATPEPGSAFAGWGGACTGSAPTCTVAMDAARTVTASFEPASAARDPRPSTPGSAFTMKAARTSTSNGGVIVTMTLAVPGPGRVTMAVFGVARALRAICRAQARVTLPGAVRLSCDMGAAARRRLARGAMRVQVRTAFTPVGGTTSERTTALVLRKTALKTPAPPPAPTG